MKVAAIIPARMAATRFPGKPLAKISGLEMIEHIRRRVSLNKNIDEVIVATCDQEIKSVIEGYGGRAIMTADTHERCTDRVAEAARDLDVDIIINVQGDEPLVNPDLLDDLVEPFKAQKDLNCSNLISIIQSDEEFQSPNEVKAVLDLKQNVLYFSREPIPSVQKAGDISYTRYKQMGIIAFRKDFLFDFYNLSPTPLEAVESVDMMRALEHGYRIQGVITEEQSISVDIPEELQLAELRMQSDKLKDQYL